ncbi:LysM peptidoglycan-binding domain-containing protein [Halobacillus faecis]
MNKKKLLVPVLALGMTFGVGTAGVSAETYQVTFEKGETLWSLAEQYDDVTVDDLFLWNPGIDADIIQPGSRITVKTDEMVSDDYPNEEFHTVTPGSTLYSIANLHEGLTLSELFELNPGIDPWNLQPGQKVRVSPAENMNAHDHTIAPYDTLYGIAGIHQGVTVQDLYELNPGIDARNLLIGTSIRVK